MCRQNGYTVHDLHKQELYSVQIGQQRCTGGVDAGVLPYAVRPGSAAKLLRIGFLHKQSTEDKAAFRLSNPDPEQVEAQMPQAYELAFWMPPWFVSLLFCPSMHSLLGLGHD